MEEGKLLAGRYRARALLRRGGMGEVWRCLDTEQGREVAVKAVLPEFLSETWAARLFHNEVTAIARLNHPGIVPVCDLVSDEDGTYLVMEVVPGAPLTDLVATRPAWATIRAVLEQILAPLAYAHARGVLHLDIKPDNVMVDRKGDELTATLLDFGIARMRRIGAGIERWFDRNVVLGTIAYMAPEQCAGAVQRFGPWTDLFSVGALAFELCAGEPPFARTGATPLDGMERVAPPLTIRPGIPQELAGLVARLLAPEPRDRPFLAADVLYALRGLRPADGDDGDDGADRASAGGGDVATAPTGPHAEVALALEVARTALADTAPGLVVTRVGVPLDLPARPTRPAPTTTGLVEVEPLAATAPHNIEATKEAFTGEAAPPRPGAYGLYGLRDLPVLGRHAERRALWSAVLSAVTDRRPRIVQLEGPAGVGKSRLARDAMERAVELGLAMALQTSWSSGGSGDEGLRGLMENMLDTRGKTADEVRARLIFWLERTPGLHGSFVREVGLLLRPPARAAPDAGLPVRVVVDALVRATAIRPVILWLDDVQWSRGEASALLAALRAHEGPLPICVITTARDDEMTESGRRMATPADATLVRMERLDGDATRKLIRGLLEVQDSLCELLATRAEGNPLFAAQLLRDLVAAGALERRDGAYHLVGSFDLDAIPADIGALWERRLSRLAEHRADLMALAVVRARVSVELVAELVRLAGRSVQAAVAAALSAGLLRIEAGAYRWTHGLLREHLLAGAPAAELPRLHRLAAEALLPLVGREDVQEERARHLRAAGEIQGACGALLEAGLWSQRRAEGALRRDRFESLLDWATGARLPAYLARALAERAYYEAELGHAQEAEELLAGARGQARGLNDGDDDGIRAWVELRASQVRRLLGRPAEGAESSRAALALARAGGELEVQVLALLQLALDHVRRGEGAQARPLLGEAADLARASGDALNEAQALRVLAALEPPPAERELLDRATELAHLAGGLRIELSIRQIRVDAMWRDGDRAGARRELDQLAGEAARRDLRQTASLLALQAAAWAASEDDWREAQAQRQTAERFGAGGGAAVERALLTALDCGLALFHGDPDRATTLIDELDRVRAGFDDDTLRALMTSAARLAPPSLAERLTGHAREEGR